MVNKDYHYSVPTALILNSLFTKRLQVRKTCRNRPTKHTKRPGYETPGIPCQTVGLFYCSFQIESSESDTFTSKKCVKRYLFIHLFCCFCLCVLTVCIDVFNLSINQSISMNLLWRPTSKALGRQKYSENTTA